MMKKGHLILLMALMTLMAFAQQPQTGDVIYVYEKDGSILSFLRDEIVEMGYSNFDTLGVAHDEVVSQIISLEEEAHIIPLADIDSISFVTPPTVYQPGVIRIEQGMMDYVVSSDVQTLSFEIAANTPANLVPKVGDKLVTLVQNDKFPVGFAGKVSAVDGTTIRCEMPPIREIFDTYYSITTGGVYEETESRTRAFGDGKPKVFRYKPKKPIVIDKSTDLLKLIDEDEFTLSGKPSLKLSVEPDLEMKIVFIVNQLINYQLSCELKGDINMKSTVGIYGKAHIEKEFIEDGVPVFVIPVLDVPLIVGKLRVSPYIEMDGEVTTSYTGGFKSHITASMEQGGLGQKSQKPRGGVKIVEQNIEPGDVSLKGSVETGGIAEFSVCLLKADLAKLALKYKLGAKFSSSFVFHPKDVENAKKTTDLYDKVKDVFIDVHNPYKLSVDYSTGEELFDLDDTLFTIFEDEPKLGSFHVVPTFRSMSFEQNSSSSKSANAFVGITADPSCLPTVQTGLRVTDSEGNIAGEWTSDEKMDAHKKIGSMTHTFDNLANDKEYKLNPTVKVMGIEMLASPSEDLDRNDFPVRILSFEQTGSHYSRQQGYEYEGIHYFYKFNATTTVELDPNAKNIKDWGYIYHDIYDVDKKISCANLGSNPYADQRYAYYFNGPERDVILYPYVQYDGEKDIQTGSTKTYPVEYTFKSVSSCPDDKHPHMIDLGLPSGTLWSCCNVGSDAPEDFGEYYAWGMITNERGTVSQYYHPDTKVYDDLGSDIARTKYDVASAKWSSAWCMPTYEQATELVEYCSNEWITPDGYSKAGGLKVTGLNGKSIYLPAAGYLMPDGTDYYFEYDKDSKDGKYYYGLPVKNTGDKSYHYVGEYWLSNPFIFEYGGKVDYYSRSLTLTSDYIDLFGNISDPNDEEMKDFYSYGHEKSHLRLPVRPVASKRNEQE